MNVIRLAITPSTQQAARHLPVGTVVLADFQTAGRGRLGRRWEAPAGTALLASFVLPARTLAVFAAGVAAAHACAADVELKWPNDLVRGEAKLAGLLAEMEDDCCVVGIGINLHWAPPGGAQLNEDREAVLHRLISELEHWFGETDAAVLGAWRARSATLGRRVQIEMAEESFEGLAEDIAEDGALVVDGRRVIAGDVVHVR